MLKKIDNKIYYTDEKTDDMLPPHNRNTLDTSNYKYYSKNLFFKFFSNAFYFGIAKPVLWLFGKIHFGIKVEGKQNLKKVKNSGYIIYGNHSHFSDAFAPQVFVVKRKRLFVIASRDAFQIKVVKTAVKLLGALPLPDGLKSMQNLTRSITKLLKNKQAILIYPEAHVFTYCNFVRNFPATSFKFAAANEVPAVPIATTYHKNKRGKIKHTIYIGEPIFCDKNLSLAQNAQNMQQKTVEFIESKLKDSYCPYEFQKITEQEFENI